MSYTFRKGINFAKKIDKYYKKEKFFSLLRKISIFFSVFTSIVAFLVVFLNLHTAIRLRNLVLERKKLVDLLLKKSLENEKLLIVADKIRYARKLLKEKDVRFLTYYRKINEIVESITNESSSSAIKIQNFELDNKRNVSFELVTATSEDYIKALEFIDRDEFLDLFNELVLTSFGLTKGKVINEYSLQFKGKFKELDE